MRLIMEEIGDFLVEGDKVVMGIEQWDIIGGVGLGGRGHGHCCCSKALKADCWEGNENRVFFL